MLLNNRHGSVDSDAYRYGFNGMERDDEVKGEGNSYTTFFRQYDPRLARWKSIDPKSVAWDSPYSFSRNSVLVFNDPLGDCPDGDCDIEKTPNGNKISVPKGSATVKSADGALHAFKSQGVGFYYNEASSVYEDLAGNVYNPKYSLMINSGSRFEKALQNKLSTLMNNNPMRSYRYFLTDEGATIQSTFGNDQYADTFYEGSLSLDDYPEVGAGESVIPVWGSGKQALYDIEDGEYGWAAINIGMAVSDVFLLKSIVKGGMTGGFKLMTKNYKNWSNYRGLLGTTGFAESGQHVHHWLFYKGGKSGSGAWWKMKNQMWNLTPMNPMIWKGNVYSGAQIHMAIHGNSRILQLTKFEKSYMKVITSPVWAKAFSGSAGFRGINEFRD